jgi:hypothetical protein
MECSKNVFAEIPITLLELKIIYQNCGIFFEKVHDLLLFCITAIIQGGGLELLLKFTSL